MKKPTAKPGNKPTFGIIGYGRFGRLWAQCLKPFGNVKIFEKNSRTVRQNNTAKNNQQSSAFVSLKETVASDFLFLLVPISEIETVSKKIAPIISPTTVVIDACSVKVHPVKMMKKWLPKEQQIIATHPLFGPDSVKKFGLKDQKIVVCNIRCAKNNLQNFVKYLKKLELKIIHATPEEHDRQMAKSQALVHFLGRGLGPLNLAPQPIATPDYNTLLRMNDMVQNDTWQLFFDMQNYNSYTKKIRQTFLKSLQKLNHAFKKKPRR